MARRLVDSASGVGSVHAGDLTLRTARYKLSFWVNDDPPAQAGATDSTTVDGRIEISGIGEAAVLSGPEGLTLTLEDGRRVAFRLKSSVGDIVGRCL